MDSRRKFTPEFKLTAVRRVEAGHSIAEVARALEVHPSTLRDWRAQVRADGQGAFPGNGHRGKPEDRVAELERKIGRQAMEIDFLKRALQHVEEQRRLQGLPSGAPSTSKSKEK